MRTPRLSLAVSFSLILHISFIVGWVISEKVNLWDDKNRFKPTEPMVAMLVQKEEKKKKQAPKKKPPKPVKKPVTKPKKKPVVKKKVPAKKPSKPKPKPEKKVEPQKKPPPEKKVTSHEPPEASEPAKPKQTLESSQVGQDEALVQSYSHYIQQEVERYWTRPPSARNGMSVKVSVRLLKDGTVMSARVVTSSGNQAFDQSALRAVNQASPFEKLAEMDSAQFNRNFRRFTFTFSPEDLLR